MNRTRMEHFFDKLVERILLLTDYFVGFKDVSISEWALLASAFGMFITAMLLGTLGPYWFEWSFVAWRVMFGSTAALHICGFVWESVKMRLMVLQLYMGLWLTKLITTPGEYSALFFVFLVLSVIVYIRLDRARVKDCDHCEQ